MSGLITEKFNINNVENLFADINSGKSAYYFWVGGIKPWPVESVPPPAYNNFNDFEQSTYHDIVFGKLITNNNIAYLIPRIDWQSGIVYDQYDPYNANYFATNTYVLNTNYSVYKCIDNYGSIPSTVQPLITPTEGVFQTSDGFTWKYMYTIPPNANTLFTSSQFIPVIPNTFVTNNAIPGTIDVMRINSIGSGYEGYAVNNVVNVLDQNSIGLAGDSVGIDNFYVGSSIYLDGGIGQAQIRKITGYNGGTRVVTVTPQFDLYVNLYLGNIVGNYIIGQYVDQKVIYLTYLFGLGYFNRGDTFIQSDTGASGIISTANGTTFVLSGTTNTLFNTVNNGYPLIDTSQSGVLQVGTVDITAGSNLISTTTANLLLYTSNTYIQVGDSSYNNVRRISQILNATHATTSFPFNNTLSANSHYMINSVVEPVSDTIYNSNGNIIQINLNSIVISYGNLSNQSLSFILGESVKEYNALGQDQAANGIISFANSSMVIISNINGNITVGNFVTGQTSALNAQILSINSYPNITLANTLGRWTTGAPISTFYSNGIAAGNATLLSTTYSPSSITQYVISPTVIINGDGFGAQAYCVVNTNILANYNIQNIVMINNGQQYTYANASIAANNLWGIGATITPILSPAEGHGANAYVELGAKNAAIAVQFNTASSENYYFPNYGSYRKIGIIKNPKFFDVWLATDNVARFGANISISSSNNFSNGEIIYQTASNSAALVVYANTTYIELSNLSNTFTSVSSNSIANSSIIGLYSNASSNVLIIRPLHFVLNNAQQIMGSDGSLLGNLSESVSNNLIRLTNVNGKLIANQVIYDATTNAYAKILTLATVNNTVNATSSFGKKFNQTSRLTFSQNTANKFFQVGEKITQGATNASAMVLDTTHEIDLDYITIYGTFTTGITITDLTTGANGIITFANSTYLKITAVNGIFVNSHIISSLTANGTINGTHPVAVVSDLLNLYPFQISTSNLVVGNISGVQGYIGISNTVSYPDLVRNTGEVIYLNNLAPFTVTPNTTQTFSLTVKL